MLPGADGPETAHHTPPRGTGLGRRAGERPDQSLVAQAIQNRFVVRIVWEGRGVGKWLCRQSDHWVVLSLDKSPNNQSPQTLSHGPQQQTPTITHHMSAAWSWHGRPGSRCQGQRIQYATQLDERVLCSILQSRDQGLVLAAWEDKGRGGMGLG